MKNSIYIQKQNLDNSYQKWNWWPLLPLYPYGIKRTLFKEVVPNQIWTFEQLQGLYYVAVPVRMTVVKVSEGLMLLNPLPPTLELLQTLKTLEVKFGPVRSIVLPTASGLEHKISMPALSRAFANAELWVCPGQWSFPFQLPLSWIGIPSKRTKTLSIDGFPHIEDCKWLSLGPINIGLGRFQEYVCFHEYSKSLIVTDSLVGIDSIPPELFDLDPTPLLFHAREKGDEPLRDSPAIRIKGWSRLVLFASFLRPEKLLIPPLINVFSRAFKPGLRNSKSHFGIYPFDWQKDWQNSSRKLIGNKKPLIQVAPVLERLVFPRSKDQYLKWLDQISSLSGMKRLIPAHFSSPIRFSQRDCRDLIRKISNDEWAPSDGDWKFLSSVDSFLLKTGVVPKDPFMPSKDLDPQV